MNRRIPEPSSLACLDRRATFLTRLSQEAWEEIAGGGFRVKLASPQFALCGFFDDLTALAIREGYEVTYEGPLTDVHRAGEWKKVREWLVMRPISRPENDESPDSHIGDPGQSA